jgi:type I restriction enzyme, S subunit
MATEWRSSTWGNEISLEYGKALRGYSTERGRFRVYGSNGAIGWTDKPLAKGPGVILGRKGAYRGVEFSRDPFFVIDTAYYVVPKTELDVRWLYYAIKHHKLGEIDDGSPIPSTTRAAVYVRDLAVPPLAEQKAIAAMLGALDDKIELNRRMNVTLEAMARALFQSWFVDFDPVRAKQEGRPPAGLDESDAALFPDQFQDSEIGEIPQGWELRSLYDTARFVNGAAFRSTDFCAANDGLPVIKIAELKDGIGTQTKFSRRELAPDQMIEAGDLLYSWSGSPDTSLDAFIWTAGSGLLNQHHLQGCDSKRGTTTVPPAQSACR